jgi:hypothetical protein
MKIRINEDSWDDILEPQKFYIPDVWEDWKFDVAQAAEKLCGLSLDNLDYDNDSQTIIVTVDGYDSLGFEKYRKLYNWVVNNVYPEQNSYDPDEEDFNEGCHGKKSNKRRKGLKKESSYALDSCPDCGGHLSDDGNGYVCDDCGETYPYEGDPGSNDDYNDDNAYCIYYVNELDSEFGYDPVPKVVEDNLERSYAYKRAEELNATAQDFEQYFVELEPKRYW